MASPVRAPQNPAPQEPSCAPHSLTPQDIERRLLRIAQRTQRLETLLSLPKDFFHDCPNRCGRLAIGMEEGMIPIARVVKEKKDPEEDGESKKSKKRLTCLAWASEFVASTLFKLGKVTIGGIIKGTALKIITKM